MRIIRKITTIRAIAVLLCYLCDATLRVHPHQVSPNTAEPTIRGHLRSRSRRRQRAPRPSRAPAPGSRRCLPRAHRLYLAGSSSLITSSEEVVLTHVAVGEALRES